MHGFFLLVLTAGLASSTTPPLSAMTAAEAARPGQYVHVRATIARTYNARSGYVFLNLDQPRPACLLEVVVKPELVGKFAAAPTQLAGRVVLVQGYVQAAEGSTAQIWLDWAPVLSIAP
ncbi:hypothetical protein IC235_11330 [Hymenobacter sp. BT664]|uniref:Uncharacterized protein n=1 Tax=Hymenobacter montanus TaxID=2771359 RepID=A0A927BDN9_9BACT|nr:hypothetical protein [Hymenobacter montanus]MBD2768481.1 hypothetical protein [Hymenobacter montanus]